MTRRASPISAIALITGFAVAAGATAVRGELRDEASITEGLIAVAIAYEIGERCDELSARRLTGINYLFALKAEAERLGYSEAEIDAFVDSDAEQDRLEGVARERLRGFGALEGQWHTYCTVGTAQIDGDTLVGRLLR